LKLLVSAIVVLTFSSSVFASYGDFGSLDNELSPSGADIASEVMPASAEKPLYCEGKLNLYSPRRNEGYEFKFRDSYGVYDEPLMSSLYWFLRCADGSWQFMDIKVIELLNYISKILGDPVINITSAYRSPGYNRKLASSNENVARNSLHMYGKAIDFRIPGMPTKEVCAYALFARNTLGYGGVGCYQTAGFVHIDSGPIRQWAKK